MRKVVRKKIPLVAATALATCATALFLGTASNASATTSYHHLKVKTNGDTQSIRFQGTAASTGQVENWCINPQYWGFTPWVNDWVDGKANMVDYTRLTVTAFSGPNCDRYQYGSSTSTVPGPNNLTNDWVDLTHLT